MSPIHIISFKTENSTWIARENGYIATAAAGMLQQTDGSSSSSSSSSSRAVAEQLMLTGTTMSEHPISTMFLAAEYKAAASFWRALFT